ncbi:MAG: nitrous oxide reductase family maturation protein NosD [Promethearchaeota archaeon]
MRNKSKIKSIILTLGILFTLITINSNDIINEQNNKNESEVIQDEFPLKIPKKSGAYTESFIHIDGSISNNWSDTADTYDWCYYENGYYIIENVTIDAGGTGSGMFIFNSDVPFIIRNCSIYNAGDGIFLYNVNGGQISNNIITSNTNGIHLRFYSDGNFITGNTLTNNYLGINIEQYCISNTISENTMTDNNGGILISDNCNDNYIISNVLNNVSSGVYIAGLYCYNTIITENIICDSDIGIIIGTLCFNVYISGNLIKGAQVYGVIISDSAPGQVITSGNSFIGTIGCHASNLVGFHQTWYYNYWDNHTSPDSDHDGIVDDPYTWIEGGSEDSYPLVESPIHIGEKVYIDDSGVSSYTWSLTAKLKIWCTGSGTYSDPYIIDGLKIDGNGSGSCILINNSKNEYFTIKNCKVYNSSSGYYEAGIKLENTNNGTLINNNCSSNRGSNGMYLYNNCENNTILGNTANNNERGILLEESCNNNRLYENTANNNSYSGIHLYDKCDNNTISGNTAINSSYYGIRLSSNCDNNTISENNINNNTCGIIISRSIDNLLLGNLLRDNKDYGIQIDDLDTQNNLIFYNLLEGTLGWHAHDDGTNNQWNYSGIGNYWDNHTSPDSNNDGIIDTPYNWINGSANSIDNKPVINYNPIFFNPQDDLNYINGITGNRINWTVVFYSQSSLNFTILRDNTPIKTDNLDLYVTYIGINVDGLGIGTYNFTIKVEDGHGGTYSDTVWVTVTSAQNPSPIIGDDDDNDDDDNGESKGIPSYNLYIIIGIICMCSVILTKRFTREYNKSNKTKL